MNAKKVTCAECGFKAHVLVPHLKQKHDMDAVAYLDKHGGIDKAPLWSELGREKLREAMPNADHVQRIPRARKSVPLRTLLPKSLDLDIDGEYQVFADPGPRTPKREKRYMAPVEQLLDLLTILEKTERNTVWIKGFSGTGKTQLVTYAAAVCNANLALYNGDAFQQRSALVGYHKVIGGEMKFIYGAVAQAMINGDWLLINEADTLSPLALNILKPVLEDPPYLPIPENGETIKAHPDFRVIATANTTGRGDSTGLFVANTHMQSDADMRRWNACIVLDYMDPEHETKMLLGYFEDLDEPQAREFVAVASKIREGFKLGKFDKTFSPAELVNWVENYIHCGRTVHHAARLSFLNKLEPAVQVAIGEYINAIFGAESAGTSTV